MSILVGTNAYAYVNYKLTGESQQDLVLTLQPKSESSVNLGIRFDSEEIIGVLVNATYHKGENGIIPVLLLPGVWGVRYLLLCWITR